MLAKYKSEWSIFPDENLQNLFSDNIKLYYFQILKFNLISIAKNHITEMMYLNTKIYILLIHLPKMQLYFYVVFYYLVI